MTRPHADVRPVTPHLGAEILGIDLSRSLDDDQFQAIRQAFSDYGVIFFRDQRISEAQHEAFAERFGPINVNRFFRPVPGHPRIAEVRKEAEQKQNIGGGWHTDHSYDEIPAMGSILLAREVPPTGGDTLFANLAAAYEALSPAFKSMLDGLKARHSARHVFGAQSGYVDGELQGRLGNSDKADLDAVHPVVVRHPDTGRKTLYVNPAFTVGIEGWSDAESQALLKFLYAHAVRPEFTCRFNWQAGSIAFWDNRATWHYAANDYHGHRRLMHRITIEGAPFQ